jgi:hypothetical protein
VTSLLPCWQNKKFNIAKLKKAFDGRSAGCSWLVHRLIGDDALLGTQPVVIGWP